MYKKNESYRIKISNTTRDLRAVQKIQLEDVVHLFDQLNTSQQIHSEINERPFDPFYFIDLLFQHKHGMVEKLLQLFVGEINAQLLKSVVLGEKEVLDDEHKGIKRVWERYLKGG
jgi:hypothetical protein